MADFLLPNALELQLVAQDLLPSMMAQRLGFDYMPVRNEDASEVSWEQMDNWVGLQQLRGLNGAPPRVKRTGAKRYIMEPGYYGEFALLDEYELTRRRAYGQFSQLIDVTDLVALEQQRLLQRRLDRIELIIWTLLTTGTFSVSTYTGTVAHTDTYTTQTFAASPGWGTFATATPLADLRAIQLLARGHSVTFDSNSDAIMNRKTANKVFSNTNAADIYGRRTAGLGTFNSPAQVNQLFAGDDLPQIKVYDKGYLDNSGTFQPFIPDNVVVVIGQRPNNQPVGEFLFVRNANNAGLAPGAHMKVIDRIDDTVPRSIEIHDGFAGGPAIYFPSAVVIASV